MGAAAIIGFLIYNFPRQTADIRMVLIICCLATLFMLGSFIHMIITRDLRHIRSQSQNEKEDPAKKHKIEF